MKTVKLIGLFLAFGILFTTVQAQKTIEGKATFEQTVEFIKSEFAGDFYKSGKFQGGVAIGTSYNSYEYKIISIDISRSCTLRVEYEVLNEYTFGDGRQKRKPVETFRRSINLAKVESISIQRSYKEFGIYSFIFREKNSTHDDEPDLPFARMAIKDMDNDSNFETLKESKVYKAFNHLRKLCDAPEPIEF